MKKDYHLPRTRKIRVYPRKAERDELKRWFGVVRRAYNIAVTVEEAARRGEGEIYDRISTLAEEVKLNKDGTPKMKIKHGMTYPATRGWRDAKTQVARQMEREDGIEWVLAVPQDVRDWHSRF